MSFESLTALFFAYLVIALKPGPHVLTLSSMAITGRLKEIGIFLCGSYTAATLSFIILLSGAVFVESAVEFLLVLVKAMAAAYFIYLGVSGLVENQEVTDDQAIEQRRANILSRPILRTVLAGFLLSISNPFNLAFILGVVPSVVTIQDLSLLDMLICRLVIIAGDLTALACYILPLYIFHKSFNERTLDWVKTASNIALILIGLYLGYQAVPAEELGLL